LGPLSGNVHFLAFGTSLGIGATSMLKSFLDNDPQKWHNTSNQASRVS
jgi:hypothetical protein